ncbi:MAG: Maf family protein [Candidatus Omnitrophota bacterium]
MRKIVLASKSKARRKLLKQTGLKFSVTKTNVIESRSQKGGASRLVVRNAILKARAAEAKFPKAIIIGADTVVMAKGKLIGKPKSLQDAENTIRLLCQNPHWVYSGLAVIDTESNKTYTAWDKTKVYMSHIDSRQIKNYCSKFRPFDKAGSFDIGGPGGMFVERIEGCFYNVVGLPLAKLVKILKVLDIDVFNL